MKLSSKSIRELLGLSKGAYGSLNKFQRAALRDYEQWIKVSSKRNKFLFDGRRYIWRDRVLPGDVSALGHIRDSGIVRDVPGLVVASDGKRVFSPSPGVILPGFGMTPSNGGKAGFGSMTAYPFADGTMRIRLTPPGVDYMDSVGGSFGGLSNIIPKEDMRTFWSTIKQVVRPGTYLSGDYGSSPLGAYMRRQPNARGAVKVLLQDVADRGLHRQGLSPDSYSAIVRQGLRDGNRLRFSRDSFTELNNSAVYNRDLYDKWRAAKTPQQKVSFVNEWNSRIYPGSARIGESGQVEFLQPFVLYQGFGGKL